MAARLLFLIIATATCIQAFRIQTPSFTFFAHDFVDRENAPIYLVTKESLSFVQFEVVEYCYNGPWIGYEESNFTSHAISLFNLDEVCYDARNGRPNSVRLLGNPANPQQNSFTYFSESYYLGVISETYFEDQPAFNGDVLSFVLTGTQSSSSISLFTLANYRGVEYCVSLDHINYFEKVATGIQDVIRATGLPAGSFKSFKFGSSCGSKTIQIPSL